VKQRGGVYSQYTNGTDDGTVDIPDYYFGSVAVGGVLLGGRFTLIVDRFGNRYLSGEAVGNLGVSLPLGGDFGVGYVNTTSTRHIPVPESEVINAITGLCLSEGISGGVGGTISMCRNGSILLNFYVSTSIGVSVGGSGTIQIPGDPSLEWDSWIQGILDGMNYLKLITLEPLPHF